ncbi:hypothetical protein [Polyangium aurulentum]|uniref:hypothetical protein n=1 Tax=Polyangium aurulentum TaxID=2567896 RepID=UPI00146AAB3A|nr:hypothetical protein [Polyangium aurulentum]UQA60087.1 hypothetical protein E8A73_006275 [Polyangium aurulentum]
MDAGADVESGEDAGADAGACPTGQHPDGNGGCECDPGTHATPDGCAPDETCMPSTCGGHGACSDGGGAIECTCDAGYSGAFCEGCDVAGGYIPDGKGGCTNTPCNPNPCPQDKSNCSVKDGMIACDCSAGTHEENGVCVPDVTCMPTTCGGHGQCSEMGGTLTCACDPGWAAPWCGACDETQGYHPDGQGGCTTDPCTPNPCKEPNKGSCTAQGGTPVCGCDAGHHDEGGTCVVDQVCAPDSCSGHGACSDEGGVVTCACDAGYTGATCNACDVAGGYHDDEMGGCTQDPCTPNPCKEPNQTTCVANGPLATCGCDAGWHDDGQGGCTQDPCVPNPCAAQNQACMSQNGQPVCYTPACDDGNPCTADSVMGGICAHTTLPNGSACSTTLCLSGQTCQAGTCAGGAQVSCDDGNPCTADSCNAITGCGHAADDGLVPEDGIACTVDKCAGGTPSNTPSNALCDDGLWCTGVEICSPASPAADGDGCIETNVPSPPPASGPCVTVGACDEATKSFPVVPKPVGSSCNDGIACTTGDACVAGGACAGAVTGDCTGMGACATTSALPGTIDIPMVSISGKITMNGQPLPATNPGYSTTTSLYLKAKDTGAMHALSSFWYSGASYTLYGPNFTSKLVAGVYDLVYRRAWDSQYNTVGDTVANDKIPNGMRILGTDLIIGAGTSSLNVDIPMATVTGTITMNGQPLPATNPGYSTTTTLYLKAKDTGAMHVLANFWYSGASYTLYGPNFTSKLVAGTYDLYYRRAWDSQYDTVGDTVANDKIPNGMRILQKDVVIKPGANNLAIDIPAATVTGTITMNGQPLPATNPGYSTTTTVYLKAKDTGAMHVLASFWYSGASYTLYGPNFTSKLVAGTYDVLYRRAWDSQYDTVGDTVANDKLPNGMRVLMKDLEIAPGANNLAIDIPAATVTGTITMNGAPLPATNPGYSTTTTLYMKAKDTGAMHVLASFWYSGASYTLYGPNFTSKLVAGTYDVLYRRAWDSQYDTVGDTVANDKIPNGMRVLMTDVVIKPGANNLAIDIPMATVSGTITMNGAPLPATNPGYSTTTSLYLKAKDTGAMHVLASFWYSGASYTLYGPNFTSKLVAGTYDVVYRRAWDSQYNTVGDTVANDKIPNGMRVLKANVVVAPGANNLAIDIPMAPMGGAITMNGAPLPATNPGYSTTTSFYLRARDTGAMHVLASFWYSGASYTLYGPNFTSKLVGGTYDVLYRRAWDSQYNTVGDTVANDKIPNGMRLLGSCYTVP